MGLEPLDDSDPGRDRSFPWWASGKLIPRAYRAILLVSARSEIKFPFHDHGNLPQWQRDPGWRFAWWVLDIVSY